MFILIIITNQQCYYIQAFQHNTHTHTHTHTPMYFMLITATATTVKLQLQNALFCNTAGRSFLKNGVRRTSKWPFSRDITIHNDGEQYCLQSDGEPKCYNQVRQSYANITLIFPLFLCAFWYNYSYNSCVVVYNILVHSKYLNNDTLFYLIPILRSFKALLVRKSNFYRKV